MSKNILRKKYYSIFTAYFLGFGILISIITSFINYNTNVHNIYAKLENLSKSEAKSKYQFFSEYINRNERLLFAITDSDAINSFVLNDNASDKTHLIDLFYTLASADKDILQLRYIDSTGMEVVRVDRLIKSKGLSIISNGDLQNKSDRYYFREASILNDTEVWHSNIDLNMENGIIVNPILPTFRLATPLFVNNRNEGIIISNLIFSDTIKELSFSVNFNIYLSDGKGESIDSPDVNSSWSRYLSDQKSSRDIFPNQIDKIITKEYYTDKRLFSYSMKKLFKGTEDLRLIFVPKNFFISELKSTNRTASLIVALTVLLISIPLSWVISIVPAKLQNKLSTAYKEIALQADIINKNVMIAKTDKDGHIIEVSEHFCDVSGYSEKEILGNTHNILKHPETPEEFHKAMSRKYNNGEIWEGDIKDMKKGGEAFWLHLVITPQLNKDGSIESFLGISQDISDKKRIELMSTIDSLTGLHNRRRLDSIFIREVAQFKRLSMPFSVILFDIDFFKKVNDSYGHIVGDSVLVNIAGLLKNNIRETDHLCRWGGEEFLIISGNQNILGASKLTEKLRKKVSEFNFPAVGKVTMSCGVSQFSKDESFITLVSRVDSALYEAKKNGRNQVICR